MKKLWIASIISCCLFTSLRAQQTNFGVKAGYNNSTLEYNKGGANIESKSGIHAGVLAHIHLSEHLALQPEIVYSSQGWKNSTEKVKLNYVNVPVLLQYMVVNGLRLQTGPQVGFLVAARQEINNVELDQDDYFESMDFSWSFGASYICKSGIGVDARYNLGLNNISDNESDPTLEIKNRVFQVGLFYQFHNNAGKKK